MEEKQQTEQSYITELEKKVTNLTRLLDVTNVMNNAILTSQSRLEILLTYLMNTSAEITDSEAASVLLWDKTRHELSFMATTTGNGASPELIGKPVPLDSIAGKALLERRMIQVDDVAKDPSHYTKLDKDIAFETKSLIGVPMIAKDKAIGVLEVVNKRELPWTMDDRNNLSTLASEVAVAIEVAQLVTELQNANHELSELDKLKSDFIAIASHELRTPLGIIMGYASFLQDSDDEAVNKHAAKVMASAMRLRRIIEDMINLRYLKQKPSGLQRERVELKTLVEDLEHDIANIIDADQHHLEIACSDQYHAVFVDRSRLAMAFMNIINNAISFTPKGGTIKIKAFVYNNEARISITDDGIGLEESEVERIFDEFYQVEDHMVRKHGGLGIGLSISRALVLAHGGRIWASSPGLNEGTTFTIALPLAEE